VSTRLTRRTGWTYTTQIDSGGGGGSPYQFLGVTYGAGIDYQVEFDPTCDGEYPLAHWAPQFYDDAVDGNTASEIAVTSNGAITVPTPTLVLGGEVSGTIVEPGGSPAENVCVVIVSPGPAFSYGYEAITDAQGNYTLDDLAALDWTLFLDPTCGGQEPSDFVDQITTAGAGASIPISVGQQASYNEPLAPAVDYPSIGPVSVSSGVVGSQYSQNFTATGGTAPFSWSAQGLPLGLSINPNTGLVTGTPSQPGSFPLDDHGYGLLWTSSDGDGVRDAYRQQRPGRHIDEPNDDEPNDDDAPTNQGHHADDLNYESTLYIDCNRNRRDQQERDGFDPRDLQERFLYWYRRVDSDDDQAGFHRR
jgi:hypothetical protein